MQKKLPLDQKTILKLQKALKKESEVLAAYLFGSQALDKGRPNSDLDLAIVVTDRSKKEEFYFLKRLSSLSLGNLHLSVVDLKTTSPLFLHQIIKNGVLVYQRSLQARITFQAQAALRFFDTQYFRETQNYYLGKRVERGTYGY